MLNIEHDYAPIIPLMLRFTVPYVHVYDLAIEISQYLEVAFLEQDHPISVRISSLTGIFC